MPPFLNTFHIISRREDLSNILIWRLLYIFQRRRSNPASDRYQKLPSWGSFWYCCRTWIRMGRGPGKRKFPRVGNYSKPRGCEKIYEVNFVRFRSRSVNFSENPTTILFSCRRQRKNRKCIGKLSMAVCRPCQVPQL